MNHDQNVATASAFQAWVFEHTRGISPALRSQADEKQIEVRKQAGRHDHSMIDDMMSRIRNHIIGEASEYEVIHTDANSRIFHAPSLEIAGTIMSGKPDLVLKHKQRNSYVIVERKTTRTQNYLPAFNLREDAWVNIEAQLWAYSHMGPWANCENITLVADIFRWSRSAPLRALEPMIWFKGDIAHESRCLRWFERYSDAHTSKL